MSELSESEKIDLFAKQMKENLKINSYKGTWTEESDDWLFECLDEEVKELEAVSSYGYNRKKRAEEILREAADVANFAMMIADNSGAFQ